MQWTIEQQNAIDSPKPGRLPSQTLLVAAAAGSGKTAVLVERIIQRLKNRENPLSIQELLVVTFTKAAAAEMSARIGKKLAEEFNETHDDYLEQQLSLLPSAHISTLHAFCQWVIRSYFYYLDIDPSFTVGNEGELGLIKEETLQQLFVEAYRKNLYNIYKLADMFGDNRSDVRLQEQILKLYHFAVAQDNPKHWLLGIKETYKEATEKSILKTAWGAYLYEEQLDQIRYFDEILQAFTNLMNVVETVKAQTADLKDDNNWYMKNKALLSQLVDVKTLLLKAIEIGSWEAMHEACEEIQTIDFISRITPDKAIKVNIESSVISNLKTYADMAKTAIKDLSGGDSAFVLSEVEYKAQIDVQLPYIDGLIDLTVAFMDAFAEAKRAERLIDFSDLEHLCLALLTKPGTETNRQPSEVALELQKTFKEVMVDEYQDTNGVQEAIVNLVSRQDGRFYVGDVKQSIYKFRMADPSLFMHKYYHFTTDPEGVNSLERRIDLAKNYRSDKEVLKFTNFLFSQIMTEEAAELTYGEAEALNPGRVVAEPPAEWVGGSVDVLLVDVLKSKKTDEYVHTEGHASDAVAQSDMEDAELANEEKEWQLIIRKLLELKEQGAMVQDKDGSSFRPMMWSDVAILMRSVSGRANRMIEALKAAGIPAYAEENGGYFEALEVQTMLALLQVLDNPEQDLPMAAVLRSVFVGMDANALGRLRASGNGSLWSLLTDFAKTEQNPQWQQFVERFERWRTLSRRQGVSDLIWQIYEDTHYVEYVSALENGLVRRGNVLALYERAKQYESGSFTGLFRFLRFLESLQESGQDLAIAKVTSEVDDVVRIMTIHKSKGLEFPVVFLADAQKGFNMMDTRESMLLTKHSGIGLKGYSEEYRAIYKTIPWLYSKYQMEAATKAEEERILYVALTRAKDKLFITGFVKDLEAYCKKYLAQVIVETEQALPKRIIQGANSYLDWILYACSRHTAGAILRNYVDSVEAGFPTVKDADCVFKLEVYPDTEFDIPLSTEVKVKTRQLMEAVRALQPITAPPLPEVLANRFGFMYSHEVAVYIPAKISVSEIKRRFAELEEEATPLKQIVQKERNIDTSRDILPEFEVVPNSFHADMSTDGAVWGTIIHEAMQWLPLKDYQSVAEVREELEKLVLSKHLTEMELDSIGGFGERAIFGFFKSPLGQRMLASNRVEHELPFSMLFDANRIYDTINNEEQLFLQGIIDTAFIEAGKWVLLDYKTDRVRTEDELVNRYRIQLALYKEALERLTGLAVADTYIYSFRLQKAVLLTPFLSNVKGV